MGNAPPTYLPGFWLEFKTWPAQCNNVVLSFIPLRMCYDVLNLGLIPISPILYKQSSVFFNMHGLVIENV